MTETTILSDSAVSEIEDRYDRAKAKYLAITQGKEWWRETETPTSVIGGSLEDIPALCATVKHLREVNQGIIDGIADGKKLLHDQISNLQSQLEQLRADLREQRDTIKFWQRHIQRMGQLLHCVAMDIDVEQAAKDLLARLAQVEQERNRLKEAVSEIAIKKYDEWAFGQCQGLAKRALEKL